MWRILTGLSFVAAISTYFAGCSLLLHPAESNAPSTQINMYVREESETASVPPDFMMSHLDLSQLKAGQHVQIWTGSPPEDFLEEILCLFSGIAGTVKEVSADRVVPQDVVMISAKPTQHGVPVASKVPYFGRLFKNTGVRREVTPVPGEVAIELSEILDAKVLSCKLFAPALKYGAERIGVDFDYSAEGEP